MIPFQINQIVPFLMYLGLKSIMLVKFLEITIKHYEVNITAKRGRKDFLRFNKNYIVVVRSLNLTKSFKPQNISQKITNLFRTVNCHKCVFSSFDQSKLSHHFSARDYHIAFYLCSAHWSKYLSMKTTYSNRSRRHLFKLL